MGVTSLISASLCSSQGQIEPSCGVAFTEVKKQRQAAGNADEECTCNHGDDLADAKLRQVGEGKNHQHQRRDADIPGQHGGNRVGCCQGKETCHVARILQKPRDEIGIRHDDADDGEGEIQMFA